jgi:hypothetical protein
VNVAKSLKLLVPEAPRSALRWAHRRWKLNRSIRRFARRASQGVLARECLADLAYGWGNEAWSASPEYTEAYCREALSARGPILECGSGLSTILVGALTRGRGIEVHALEHLEPWADRVRSVLERLNLDHVQVHGSVLRDHGDFYWYEVPDGLTRTCPFHLVICDGPPGDVHGGRYGLLPVMSRQLAPGCVILLDDMERPAEQATLERWRQNWRLSWSLRDASTPFAHILYEPGGTPRDPLTFVDRGPELAPARR